MKGLDHWHPVLFSEDLGPTPSLVRVEGHDLVLFRTKDGQVGALDERCPHRRMSLGKGRVGDDRLICAYHGWNFDCHGQGKSPGNPDLNVQARHYEVRETHGAIWIKNPDSSGVFPGFDLDGFTHVDNQHYRIHAPLELVLDNFTEVEHTGQIHALLGYEPTRTHEIDVVVQPADDHIRVTNEGPQKSLPWWIQRLFGIRAGDIFVDDWVSWFSPVYTVYDHWWKKPQSGNARANLVRSYVFFVPENPNTTRLLIFAYAKSSQWGEWSIRWLLRPILRRLLAHEVRLDIAMIEDLKDMNPDLEGMRLSRFDRVLGLNRERIQRIYRGATTTHEDAEPNPL